MCGDPGALRTLKIKLECRNEQVYLRGMSIVLSVEPLLADLLPGMELYGNVNKNAKKWWHSIGT